MANNIQPRFSEDKTKWWQTDTGKATLTIIAVLLVPGVVVAYNYATKNGSPENGFFGNNEESTEMDTIEENKEAKGNSLDSDLDSNIDMLPDTNSTIIYKVKANDTVVSISQKLCGDDSYKRADKLVVGETIQVECD